MSVKDLTIQNDYNLFCNSITQLSGAPGGVSQVSLRVTSAELLAMPGTPFTILDVPPSGQYYAVQNVNFDYIFNGTPYTVTPGINLVITVGGQNNVTPIDAGFLSNGDSFTKQQSGGNLIGGTAGFINQPLLLNLSGAITVGNGDLKVTVDYSLITPT